MIDLDEKVWGTDDVERGLRQLPSLISSAALVVAKKDAEAKQAKHILNLLEAGITVNSEGKEKKTATELKAEAYLQTKEERYILIQKEKELEIARADYQKLRDMFDSVRKQANIFIEERKRV